MNSTVSAWEFTVPQLNGRGGANFLGAQIEDELRVYANELVLSPN